MNNFKRDYPEYEGKELKFIIDIDDLKYDEEKLESYSKINWIVALCSYDIGISIVNKKDKDYHHICLNGAFSPNKKDFSFLSNKYDALFKNILFEIQQGTLLLSSYGKRDIIRGFEINKNHCMASCPAAY